MADELPVPTVDPAGDSPLAQPKSRDIFFGTAMIVSLVGLMGLGVLFWMDYPKFEAGAMLIAYTLSNVVSFVLGSKSGLSAPGANNPAKAG